MNERTDENSKVYSGPLPNLTGKQNTCCLKTLFTLPEKDPAVLELLCTKRSFAKVEDVPFKTQPCNDNSICKLW
jgi:hypothetical protein